ncbi:hypothetical protein [Aestuariimicrobium sp. T2.26MG-19.2B]|uniref:hypothetical protein n=1 Tax=Aestuariimicrobium sp. T2.26MG-19.2B TaxID=3040679 RepID=UPI0025406AB6|nr:hypothetical protein [Aestuariimicrobium sp. T2.26MG-19.2B]
MIGDEDTNAFGNQVVLLVHDNIRVRLVRDRGQWFLEIDAALTDEWFSPVIWMALLDKELPDARRPSAEKEASFVVRRWPDFDVLATPCAVEKLRAWQERRAAQLGALEREQSSDAT